MVNLHLLRNDGRMPYALRAGTLLRSYPSGGQYGAPEKTQFGGCYITKTRASTPPEGHRALLQNEWELII